MTLRRLTLTALLDLAGGGLLLALLGGATVHFLGLPLPALAAALATYALIAALIARHWLPLPAFAGLGPANRVTLLRAVLVALVAGALVAPDWLTTHASTYCVTALIALALDGVDGWVARKRQAESDFGAAFDMELDALLILALSLACWLLHRAGAWVLLIGAMRYLFVIACTLWPWLAGRDLPPRFIAKLICVVQIAALLFALAPRMPRGVTEPVLALALALLLYSFGRDAWWLWRAR